MKSRSQFFNTTKRVKIPQNKQEYLSALMVGGINSNRVKVA
jgi:hypothetical protein